jgi:hypothetical protein
MQPYKWFFSLACFYGKSRSKAEMKNGPTSRAIFWAKRTGLADMLPAADSLASESLRVPNRIVRRDNALAR